MKNWRNWIVILALVAYTILFWWWAASGYPTETKLCHPPGSTNNCESHNIFFALTVVALDKLNFYGVLITAVATGFIAWFTWTLRESTEKMWIETKRSVDIAQQAYLAEHRTWLKVYITETGPVVIEKGKIRVTLTVEAQNVGNNPAVAVNLECQMYQAVGFGAGQIEIAELVEITKTVAAHFKKGGELLPGEKTSMRFTADAATVARLEVATREQIAAGVPEANMPLTLSAAYCVIYKAVASDEWKYSAHVHWITRRDGGSFKDSVGEIPVAGLKGRPISSESRFG
jgi:hypothetical protein